MTPENTKRIAICDTQPITAEGLRILIQSSSDLKFLEAVDSIERGLALAEAAVPDILIIDKGFGMHAVLNCLSELKTRNIPTAVIVWGVSMTEPEALRLLQCGARGIVRKTADLEALIGCIQTVSAGKTWMQDCVFRDTVRPDRSARPDLTPREHQVLQLVEQGFKNREIAVELGIRPGTVKIHLKHIFEKTGVHGRYGLALTGLKDRGMISLAMEATG